MDNKQIADELRQEKKDIKQKIQRLKEKKRQTIKKKLSKSDAEEVVELHEKTSDKCLELPHKIDSARDKITSAICALTSRKRTSINQKITIRDGDIYKYNSSSHASLRKIVTMKKTILETFKNKEDKEKTKKVGKLIDKLRKVKQAHKKYIKSTAVDNDDIKIELRTDYRGRLEIMFMDPKTYSKDKLNAKLPQQQNKLHTGEKYIRYCDEIKQGLNNLKDELENDIDKIESIEDDVEDIAGAYLAVDKL